MWKKLILLRPNKENNTFSYDKHRSNQNCPWDLTRRPRQAQPDLSRTRGPPKSPPKSPRCVYAVFFQSKVGLKNSLGGSGLSSDLKKDRKIEIPQHLPA